MRRLLRALSIAAAVTAANGLDSSSASTRGDCRQESIRQLKAASPDGFAIYRQTTQPDFFTSWIDCSDVQYNLSTAVHESTHFISAETDAFPLVGGGAIARPHEVSAFYPPYRVASRFKGDDLAAIYLRKGKASSATDFLYLLDEFNAYTHDLATATDLRGLHSDAESVDHRDGLAGMMAFLAVYAETARRSEPETWNGLRMPGAADAIRTLYARAERVMAASCGIPDYGTNDKAYLRQVCAHDAQSALGEILGRAPACPSACLEEAPDQVLTSGEALVPPSRLTTQESLGPRHPFNVQVGAPRHKAQAREREAPEQVVQDGAVRDQPDQAVEDQAVEER